MRVYFLCPVVFSVACGRPIEDTSGGADSGPIPDAVEVDAIPHDPDRASIICEADAFVRDGQYETMSFGAANNLIVKRADEGFNREVYLRFNLTQAAGGTIDDARLRLWLTDLGVDAVGLTHEIRLVENDGWDEATLTWLNRPTTTSDVLGTWTLVAAAAFVELDVTAVARLALAGDRRLTFLVRSRLTSGSESHAIFGSRESTMAPRLELRGPGVGGPPPTSR